MLLLNLVPASVEQVREMALQLFQRGARRFDLPLTAALLLDRKYCVFLLNRRLV